MSASETESVRRIIRDWTRAISKGDRSGILAHHADDVPMFDFPATVKGLASSPSDAFRSWRRTSR